MWFGLSAAGCTMSGHGPGRGSANLDADAGTVHPPEKTSTNAAAEAGIELRAVHYAELDATIRQQVGKVVVVDFWIFSCQPCKAGFPYLVQLHEKYGKHGLVVMAVNMDDPGNTHVREQALAFLKSRHARFTNLAVYDGEDPGQWVDQRADLAKGGTGFEGDLPFTEVYDRKGNLVLHKVDVDHDELDRLVQELLLKH
jgi:thiol-disulfide isomerase/thioredoxin